MDIYQSLVIQGIVGMLGLTLCAHSHTHSLYPPGVPPAVTEGFSVVHCPEIVGTVGHGQDLIPGWPPSLG